MRTPLRRLVVRGSGGSHNVATMDEAGKSETRSEKLQWKYLSQDATSSINIKSRY
jgi:hypothetical protein